MSADVTSPGTAVAGAQAQAQAQAQATASAMHLTLKRRALVVVESEAARLLLKRLLVIEAVEVITARNGDDAAECILRDPLGFGLIVMELSWTAGTESRPSG